MRSLSPVNLVRGAMIAAIYVVVTVILQPVSFGPFQFRLAEALTVLPILFPEASPAYISEL